MLLVPCGRCRGQRVDCGCLHRHLWWWWFPRVLTMRYEVGSRKDAVGRAGSSADAQPTPTCGSRSGSSPRSSWGAPRRNSRHPIRVFRTATSAGGRVRRRIGGFVEPGRRVSICRRSRLGTSVRAGVLVTRRTRWRRLGLPREVVVRGWRRWAASLTTNRVAELQDQIKGLRARVELLERDQRE